MGCTACSMAAPCTIHEQPHVQQLDSRARAWSATTTEAAVRRHDDMLALYRRSMMEQTPQHARLRRRPLRTPGSFQKTPGSAATRSTYEQDSFVTEGECSPPPAEGPGASQRVLKVHASLHILNSPSTGWL